jgi:hypothetical protein
VLGFVSRVAGNRNQIDAQTLIDQKSHFIAMVISFRRMLRAGG